MVKAHGRRPVGPNERVLGLIYLNNRCHDMMVAFPVLTLLMVPLAEPEVVLDRPVPALVTGSRFESELRGTISASWQQVALRPMLRRISEDRHVGILLDRRIDPTQELAVDFDNQTLLSGLQDVARRAGGAVSVVGNTVYIGPLNAAAKLRTLVQLRSNELFALGSQLARARHFALADRRILHWNDLAEPRDLVEQIAQRYKLQVENVDLIPHDLWAGATLPDVDAWEALSLVLIQFDLTFEWTGRAAGIRIVPVPRHVWIEERYTPPEVPAGDVLRQWEAQRPGLALAVQGDQLIVRGTVEQQEAVEELLRPGLAKERTKHGDAPIALRRRTFTLRLKRAPARAVMKKLEMSGVVFRYDAQKLAKAGIDLDTPVSMELHDATADEFFRALCDPLGLKFEIHNVTVTLSPQ